MKRFVLSLFFCCCVFQVVAQTSAVMATKMNILYIGVPNPVSVVVDGYDCKDVSIAAIDDMTVTRMTELCDFEVMVERPGAVRVHVAVKDVMEIKTIGIHQFQAKYVPDPEIRFGGKRNSSIIPLAEAKAQTGIVAVLDHFDIDCRFKTTSYKTEVLRNDKIVFSHINIGGAFDAQTSAFFRELQAGDRLVISEIRVVGPDKRVRAIEPVIFALV